MKNSERLIQIKAIGAAFGVVLLWAIWLSFFEDAVVPNIHRASYRGSWNWVGWGSVNVISSVIIFACLCIFSFRQYKNNKKVLSTISSISGFIALSFAILSGFVGYVDGLPVTRVTSDEADKLMSALDSKDGGVTAVDISLPEYSIEYAKDQFLVLSKPTPYWTRQMPLRSRLIHRHSDYEWYDNRNLLEQSRSTLHKRFISSDFKLTRNNIENHLENKGRISEVEKQHGYSFYDEGVSDFVRYLDWRYSGKVYAILYLNEDIDITLSEDNILSINGPDIRELARNRKVVRAMYAVDIPNGTTPYNVRPPESFAKSFRESFRYGIREMGKDLSDRMFTYRDILKAMLGLYDIQSAVQKSDACWLTPKRCLSISDATQVFYKAIEENNAQGVTAALQSSFLTDNQIEQGWDMAIKFKSPSAVSELIPAVDRVKRGLWLDKELYSSVKTGDVSMVRALLNDRINGKYQVNKETLFWAVENSDVEIVELLLAHGFSHNFRGDQNLRPIHVAARSGRPDIIETLVSHGADINAADRNGETVLQYAIKDEYQADTLLFLFQNPDLDVNEMDRQFYIEKLRQYIRMNTGQTITFDDSTLAAWKSGELIDYLDRSGNSLGEKPENFHQTPWHCIADNMSGLTWTVKHDMGGVHDKSLQYWNKEPDNSTCQQEVCNVDEVVRQSNNDKLCGHSDWRIPSVTELASLAFPNYKSAFPFSPGFLFWTYYGDSLVITSANGILGERSTIEDPFSGMNEPYARVLLVTGEIRPIPEEPDMDYQAKFFDN